MSKIDQRDRGIRRRSTARRGGVMIKALVALVVVAGGVGGIYAFGGPDSASDAGLRTDADFAEVTKGGFDITTTATGELEAKNQIELRSQLESESSIVEIVPEGSRVKKDDVLIRLKTDKIQQEIDRAELEVQQARAQLTAAQHAYDIQVNDNEKNLRQATLKVELAELDYRQWLEGETTTKRQANQLAISKSSLELERLAAKLEESYKLLQRGYLSADEYEQDKLRYIEAQSAWVTAGLAHEVFEAFEFPKSDKKFGSDVADAKADLEQVRLNNEIQLASKLAERTNRENTLKLHEERLKKQLEQRELAVIRAPSDGLVVYATSVERWSFGPSGSGPLQVGRQVYPNETLIILPDTSEMMATVRVHERMADRISTGQKANVKIDAAGGRIFQGVVDSKSVLAENSWWRDPNLKEMKVKIQLTRTAESEALKPSNSCEATIFLDRAEDVVMAPIQAVFSEGEVRYVLIPDGPRMVRTPVRVGRSSDTRAEILAGLSGGERVLLRNPTAAEQDTTPFDNTRLIALGYEIGQDGKARAPRPERRSGPTATASAPDAKAPQPAAAATDPKPVDGATPAATAADAKPAEATEPADAKPDEAKPAEPTAATSSTTSSAATAARVK